MAEGVGRARGVGEAAKELGNERGGLGIGGNKPSLIALAVTNLN
jgi:hypothetical protein